MVRKLIRRFGKWMAAAGVASMVFLIWTATSTQAQKSGSKSTDYDKVFDGYTKVVSTADGKKPMYEIWVDKKNGQMLAQLHKDFARKKYFIALTVAGGEKFAGLQEGDMYVYWKKYGDRLALIEPNHSTRSTGDQESKSSVERLFTDRVIVDVPILATSPRGEPVIDMDELLVKYAPKFFSLSMNGVDPVKMYRLRAIKTAKAFPENVEVAFEIPHRNGQLKTLHYSISELPESTGYKARKADDRVGYFTTSYLDLGKYKRNETKVRFINRWRLEKADPSLKLSPPKNPIVFYIEHTTPIRYRRFVRDGVLYWNKAFEKVGIDNAVEVYYQDKTTGAHMEKDPEDVRYNFVRWLNNNVGTAIGPSRVHPLTGEILDADIILTDGWIRHFETSWNEILPKFAMESFGPETLAWLENHPNWDPRILLAPTHQRNMLLAARANQGPQPLGGHPLANQSSPLLGDDQYDGLFNRVSQVNGMCLAAESRAFDLTMLRMTLAMLGEDKDGKDNKETEEEELDGIPAKFVGPLLADLVAHEVGHTLGLRHNFKASSVYTLKEINSKKLKGKEPFASSVMDYLPVNINMKDGEIQGDWAMIGVGPYDMWAIEYGYTLDEKELPKILARCKEKELQYSTDQDTIGPDPLARRYDFTAEPLDYAKNQMKLANYHRQHLLDKFVKKGESWSKARKGYDMTLSMQTRSLSMMANWIGGVFVSREHKGDNGDTAPVKPVPVAQQRAALKWVLENAFRDDAFGLTPKLLQRMKNDHLSTDESFYGLDDFSFPIHDRVMGIQGSVLTMLMNPSTLRMVYDNELMTEADQDALTLPELLKTVEDEVWSELAMKPNGKYTARKPMVSSLRRNLQREYIERLIDLVNPRSGNPAATKPISTLAIWHLRKLNNRIDDCLKRSNGMVDPYTQAHLSDANTRITKVLDSQYIFNAKDIGGGGGGSRIIIGNTHSQLQCNVPGCQHCSQPGTASGWYNK